MATISISKQHKKSRDEIERLVEDLRRVLEGDYGCRCERRGDQLEIARRGINGSLQILDDRVDVEIRLGPMMGLLADRMKPFINAQLSAHLDD
ncbi:MAG: polyhydroxyalkanoic acid system family protein [Pseudomonadales bacterium]